MKKLGIVLAFALAIACSKEEAQQTAADAAKGTGVAAGSMADAAKGAAGSMTDAARGAAGSLGDAAKSAAGAATDSARDAAGAMAGAARDTAGGIATAARQAVAEDPAVQCTRLAAKQAWQEALAPCTAAHAARPDDLAIEHALQQARAAHTQ